ncbi:glycosyltransferase [Hyphomicrobium zavarzinii]|uniref:glycosyltransferase n=1 Tax=Hyphomicrobium zavarzinii TaxID=48292 RepID=UPI0003612A93|nr:glycosyltransferase [Hyphomicrobium zavarzinii]
MTTPSVAKPKAVVAHPLWGRGGAECAAMWIIEALLRDFDVTVYTRGGFDLNALNRLANLKIAPSQVRIRIAERTNAWPLGTLAHGDYLRSLRAVGAEYDLRVTASGVVHWGLPAMHFISSAVWNDTLADKFDAPNAPRNRSMARAMAWRLASVISGERVRSLHNDLFIANSHWTARQSAPFCPGPIEMIYPAVPLSGPGPDWDRREDGVLVFGRVSPEKRIETCINIIERLRKSGSSLRLCIAGPNGDVGYGARIDALCRERSGWIERVPFVNGIAKQHLLGRFRYGLSACEIEAFGIATAEMTAAGIVVFAPQAGAQREILNDPRQLYSSVDEAISHFGGLLDDQLLQRNLHVKASTASQQFAPEHFISKVQDLAGRFVVGSGLDEVAAPEQTA